MDSAELLIEKSINLMLKSKKYVQEKYIDENLPYAYLIGARISYTENKYSRALAFTRCGQAYDSKWGGTFSELVFLEGQIWQAIDQPSRAEVAYFKAWRQGKDEAEDSLKSLFIRKFENLKGYSLYVKMLADELLKEAPVFTSLTIDSNPIKLEDLRRKIVVLTFWFIGCPGCEIERDAMNRLAKKYDEKNVVFIALARDGEARLKDYVLKNTYNAIHIPGAESIAEKFSVQAYPTHFIIDGEGRIDAKVIGGSKDTDIILENFIERCRRLWEE